jgi:hypothetical protein
MHFNNWSIPASYDTARIFAGFGFGSSTASRSLAVAPHRLVLCSGSIRHFKLCVMGSMRVFPRRFALWAATL